jgi:hypothetical protein
MAFRRAIVAVWLFAAATVTGQTVEELRVKLAQADIDKAVLAERQRANDHPTSAVLIALIGALPALYAAYLTHLGNKMVKAASQLGQSMSDKSSARAEVLAVEAQTDREHKAS